MPGGMLQGREWRREDGNILVSALLLLLVMSLMGVALIQSAVKNSRTAVVKTVDSEVFHLTESCTHQMMNWLRSQTRPPESSTLPYTVSKANLNHLLTGSETAAIQQKLQGYSYNCSLTELTIKSAVADGTDAGSSIGMSSAYGTSGDTTPRYYYQVDATGAGPQNSAKRIVTIVSLQY